jgi:hypothetical protein
MSVEKLRLRGEFGRQHNRLAEAADAVERPVAQEIAEPDPRRDPEPARPRHPEH